MPGDFSTCTTGQLSAAVAAQTSRIRLEAIEFNMRNDPYAAIYEGGTTPAGEGETITTIVPDRTVLNQSMTAPEFTDKTQICGTKGNAAEFGQTQYVTKLRNLRGRGPTLCLHQNFNSVEGALAAMERDLKRSISELMIADNRYNLLLNSGHKFVAKHIAQPWDLLTGGENQIAVNFVGGLPTSPMTHRALVELLNYGVQDVNLDMHGSGAGAYATYIASSSLLETMRNETGLKTETLAFVQGSDADAKAALKRYQFVDYPYRGIKTAVDTKPLRFNAVNASGFPILIEPYIRAISDQGTAKWVNNPAWRTAGNEVSFLVFRSPFRRLVPEQYTGEGGMKFPEQNVMGDLRWSNPATLECNEWQDYGRFIYQISRAFQAIKPYAVFAVLSKRCIGSFGFDACTGISGVES